ncbi:hypothetical protein GBAR_LOCUS1996 [Geodia barretti]|uniref:Uncharacterized protein n=1 Tax=Geodia barretti TaxID=519541 RepID=A0AA35W268_GEOBA|nr:hypothetical protein GBAR_LOCUS387 [Geodia barretti]CAI7996926.1 hypothetical protein GBAR_LOCUS1996 [Geodia barretti]
MREVLRCIFWCLRGTQSTRIGQIALCNGAVSEKTAFIF